MRDANETKREARNTRYEIKAERAEEKGLFTTKNLGISAPPLLMGRAEHSTLKVLNPPDSPATISQEPGT